MNFVASAQCLVWINNQTLHAERERGLMYLNLMDGKYDFFPSLVNQVHMRSDGQQWLSKHRHLSESNSSAGTGTEIEI